MSTLAERIIEARLEAGITEPAEMARRAGVKPAAAYQWESGATKSLKAETAIALADVLGVSMTWLTTGKGQKRLRDGVAEPISTYDATPSHPFTNRRQKVRVEGMGAMDDQGFWKPGSDEADLWEVNTDDPKAYAIRVLTQHFQNVVAPGQILLVSPSHELKLGRWVLVTLHDGRRTFRTFRGHEYGMWHFAAVNDQAAYLDLSDADVRTVERVMSVWWTD